MSLADDDIPSSNIFDALAANFSQLTDEEKKKQVDAVKGIFQLCIKNSSGKEGVWTVDMKKEGKVEKGPAKPKADVIINMSDETFEKLSSGKLNGQKAFMSGQLKVKGNIMLATKLDGVLKNAQSKL